MSRRKKPYVKKEYESTGFPNDTSSNIYHSMLISEAWKSLSAKQKELYVCCKDRKYQEKNHPDGDESLFYMNKYLWSEIYQIYSPSDGKGFQRDLRALISYGFIRCVKSGANTRTKSVYQFSAMWKKFGTKEFKIEWDDMNAGLARRTRNSQKHEPGVD